VKAEDIRTAGVIGGGEMGTGIAMVLAQAGLETTVVEVNEERLEKARTAMRSGPYGWEAGVERGALSGAEAEAAAARVRYTTELRDIGNADLVVEAIPEDEELKRGIWSEIERVARRDAIFATNTSGLAISSLNQSLEGRERFLGMHWFSPATERELVELVYTPDTSEATVATMEGLVVRLGRRSIRAKDAPGTYGFVANRIFFAAVAEARKVVESGVASEEDVDAAMRLGFGWPQGPLEKSRGGRGG
jgi:3-hydroxybutyryl-CoA dehydrogenase